MLLSVGAEQAGDTTLPSVFFSRSLRKTIACVQHMTCPSPHNEVLSGSWTHYLIPPEVDTILTHPGNQAKALQSMQDEAFKSATLKLSINGPADSRKSCNQVDDQAAEIVAISKPVSHASGGSAQPAHGNGLKTHSSVAVIVPVRLLAHVEGGLTVREAIKQQVGSNECVGPVVLAIGPEGGWVADEVALLTDMYGYQAATIAAGRTLDTTTAATALVSIILEVLTDQYKGSE